MVVEFDFRNPEFLAGDRFPAYRKLRDENPVARLGPEESWVVSRHEDISAILADRSVRMRPEGKRVPDILGHGAAARMYRNGMALSDPPDHSRLRKLVSYAFTPKALSLMKMQVQAIVASALDDLGPVGERDLMADYAQRIPMHLICGMLGVPIGDGPLMVKMSQDFGAIFFAEGQGPETLAKLDAVCQRFFDYFGSLIDRKRREPADDLTSALVAAEDGGDRLTHDELVAILRGILTAGLDTTASVIANAIYGLLTYPDQLAVLKAEPDLISNAVEEFLRWQAPFHSAHRYLGRDVELHGQTMRAGERVWLLVGSANRDERKFDDPDRLDVRRGSPQHLSFGGGVHFCLGASLARMEVQTAIGQFVARVEQAELVEANPPRNPDFLLPWFVRLPIAYRMKPAPEPADAALAPGFGR